MMLIGGDLSMAAARQMLMFSRWVKYLFSPHLFWQLNAFLEELLDDVDSGCEATTMMAAAQAMP